jgi:hypothetical protein
MRQQIVDAISAALHPPASVPSPAQAPAPPPCSTAQCCPNPPRQSSSAGPPPGTWHQNSAHPVLAVLHDVHQALCRHNESELAARLLWAKDVVDYTLSPAKLASDTETENVYQAKHSGKRWSTTSRPPRPCHNCGEMHWRQHCPHQQTEQDARSTFPRGKPPGRYYISRGGVCFDTRRRPNGPCTKCGALHFWFQCRENGDTVRVPKGGKFVDEPTGPVRNASSSRTKPRVQINEDGTASTSGSSYSEYEQAAPVKRKHRHAPRHEPAPSPSHHSFRAPAAVPPPPPPPPPPPAPQQPAPQWSNPPWIPGPAQSFPPQYPGGATPSASSSVPNPYTNYQYLYAGPPQGHSPQLQY